MRDLAVKARRDLARAIAITLVGLACGPVGVAVAAPPPPSVESIEPSSGPAAGGTPITIRGKGFLEGATVTIGSAASEVKFVSATELTAMTPAGSGSPEVIVSDEGGSSTLNPTFTYIAPPTVESITPNQGPTAGGTLVQIKGKGFLSGSTVTIGGAASEVKVVNEEEITAKTPAGSGAPEVIVTDTGGSSTLGPTYIFIAPPTVESITPSSGSTAGGTPVTIKGGGFASPATVTIGSEATEVEVVTPEEIKAKTAAGAAGSDEVTVSDLNGTSSGGPSYTYSAPPPPTVTLNQPVSPSNNTTPSFSGTASDTTTVTIHIYKGAKAEGTEVSKAAAAGTGGSWSSGEANLALTDGHYTAIATQPSSLGSSEGTSNTVTFVVNTASPTVTLNQPESPSNNTTPSFTGTASDTEPVTVHIYKGTKAEGPQVSSASASGTEGGWSSGEANATLASGRYTAIATQASSLGNPAGVSAPVTFMVDTAPPTVTLNTPVSPSNNTTPSFTGSASDITLVTVKIYLGPTATGSVLSTATATGTGGGWTSGEASSALLSGKHTYTAIATQSSSLGNPVGRSLPVTFIVDTDAPTVTLNSPVSPSNNITPSFTGTASDTTQVTVNIYAGGTATGPVISSATATGTGGSWTSGNASPALKGGRYTATATQTSSLGNHLGVTAPDTFTIDTTPPHITLTSPASGSSTYSASQAISGSAGTAEGDQPAITVQLFSGSSTANQTPQESILVNASKGAWSTTFGGLSPGVYTVRAEQSDDTGNVGLSNTTTFTLLVPAAVIPTPTTSPPVQPPPTAFPPARQPLAASFTSSPPIPRTMLPFPIVRIAGSIAPAGVKLNLLTVQAPGGAQITIRCRGRGCPKTESRVVASRSAAGMTLVKFRRFERSLRAGAVLEIRVSKGEEIGKYTRFTIRRGKSPARFDACLDPLGAKPIACPSS